MRLGGVDLSEIINRIFLPQIQRSFNEKKTANSMTKQKETQNEIVDIDVGGVGGSGKGP